MLLKWNLLLKTPKPYRLMAEFAFSARDTGGQLVSSNVQAADRKEALRKIRSRGLTPIKVSNGTGAAHAQRFIRKWSQGQSQLGC